VLQSFVLRLSSEALLRGEVVGEVEHVTTGLTSVIRSAADLAAACALTADPDLTEHHRKGATDDAPA
jgi:hypothetical protein